MVIIVEKQANQIKKLGVFGEKNAFCGSFYAYQGIFSGKFLCYLNDYFYFCRYKSTL